MPNECTKPDPSSGDATSAPPTEGRSGDPAFLGRPDAGEGRAEFIRRVVEALLGKDDPRLQNWQPKSDVELKDEQ